MHGRLDYVVEEHGFDKMKKNFAIIGGGATGPLLLSRIAEEALENNTRCDGLTIHLIDPNGFGNGGIAYGMAHSNHKLNSIPSEMNGNKSSSFPAFLNQKNILFDNEEFNTRASYKPYIKDELVDKPIAILRSLGAQVVEHRSSAFIKKDSSDTYSIVDQDPMQEGNDANLLAPELTELTSDDFVLTVGYGGNNNFKSLQGKTGYVHNIYDRDSSLVDRFPQLGSDDVRIAVLGSGPGLYDVANELNIIPSDLFVFSSSGKELSVRDVSVEDGESSTPPQQLLNMDVNASLDRVLKCVSDEFQTASSTRSHRRIGLDINKSLKEILHNLDESVAEEFLKSPTLAYIKHCATPVPLASKEKLEQLSPTFVRGRVRDENITTNDDGSFTISSNGNKCEVDVIINATGHGRHNAPILNSLKQADLTSVSKRTAVLDTDHTGYRLCESGIAVIGPATHIGTDGMESFAQFADDLAKKTVQNWQPLNEDTEPQLKSIEWN